MTTLLGPGPGLGTGARGGSPTKQAAALGWGQDTQGARPGQGLIAAGRGLSPQRQQQQQGGARSPRTSPGGVGGGPGSYLTAMLSPRVGQVGPGAGRARRNTRPMSASAGGCGVWVNVWGGGWGGEVLCSSSSFTLSARPMSTRAWEDQCRGQGQGARDACTRAAVCFKMLGTAVRGRRLLHATRRSAHIAHTASRVVLLPYYACIAALPRLHAHGSYVISTSLHPSHAVSERGLLGLGAVVDLSVA